jgi:hypothetical protein
MTFLVEDDIFGGIQLVVVEETFEETFDKRSWSEICLICQAMVFLMV